jgi:hypothetical protein
MFTLYYRNKNLSNLYPLTQVHNSKDNNPQNMALLPLLEVPQQESKEW